MTPNKLFDLNSFFPGISNNAILAGICPLSGTQNAIILSVGDQQKSAIPSMGIAFLFNNVNVFVS